jgi:hypothetical protein
VVRSRRVGALRPEQGDTQLVLCGDDAVNQAPRDVLDQCGA